MGVGIVGARRGRIAVAALSAGVLVPAALAGATAPAGAAALAHATVSVDQACYVITSSVPKMTITGSGFEPGVPVTITASPSHLASAATATPDALGDISATVDAPVPKLVRPEKKGEIITATQDATTGQHVVGTTHTWITALGAEHGPTHKEPGLTALTETTTWSFSGFPVGKTVYAHYLIAGKQVALQSFGRAPAPCGVLKVRARLFPKKPLHRSYPLQIDTSRRLVKNTAPKITRLRVSLALEF